jgi:pimeloyl-ACP methyl ester carboxylesterase
MTFDPSLFKIVRRTAVPGLSRVARRIVILASIALAASVTGGCASSSPPPAVQPRMTVVTVDPPVRLSTAAAAPATRPAAASGGYLLHLPGIGGVRSIDVDMVDGLKMAGFSGKRQIIDWTGNDPGIGALQAYDRNRKEAAQIAKTLTARFDADPQGKLYLSSHSGGGGLAVWALEALPERVKVETVFLMSPALSPDYDLTKALRHVAGKMYVFSSLDDQLVLGYGCRMFGTIDGKKCDAAGRVGFTRPPDADPDQYAKLVPMPYKLEWARFGDFGNHIGGMTAGFARAVLAPLILSSATSTLPPVGP